MEQFRHVGEVLGSIRALMVLEDDIQINQSQCRLLLDMFSLTFNTIAEEIRQNLKLEEKNSKWKALEQPLRELQRVFKEGELYIKHCMDSKDWWGKAISFHQNKDCVEFHVHNLFVHFPAVIEAIENAGEISGLDHDEMRKRRIALVKKYDKEWSDPKLFQWRFGKQYLVPKEICKRLESAWKEDRWRLIEALQEKRSSTSISLTKNELRLSELLLNKLNGSESFRAKLFPSSILLGAKDYQVRRRLGGGSQYKEIQWLGESFVLRHFFGEIQPLASEISTLLSLSHSNILQYLCGFCDEDKKECFLVMELMNKDLSSYMKENSSARRRVLFSLPVVVDLMLQIARGMEYLHSQKIYHGELKPFNIFLKGRNSTEGYLQAKISGFGLCSVNNTSSRNSPPRNPMGTFIWHAPEVLAEQEQPGEIASSSKYTEKADVYSFGMLCFQLLTGKVPFEDGHLQGDKMSRNIRAGERPLFPHPSPKYLVSLTKKCWQTDPSHRPCFSSICRILRYIKKYLAMNPDQTLPELQSPSIDYCDVEASFLKKISAEGYCSDMASVSKIPFQMFAYRLLENEKTYAASKHSYPESTSDTGSICRDTVSCTTEYLLPVMEDLVLVPEASDTRSICSETPFKRTPSVKKSPEVKSRKSSVTPKAQTPKRAPLNRSGRSLKLNGETQLKLLMKPLRQGRGRTSGHVSDSEIQ
ncbi:Tyrosine-protein kinase [Parasponia andersonii]|uniref:Tyrosine-protein kinase n=1 Tax=Parasponia andersonii TaxID=3476 RepID=A0A2P5B687_PARAD|nr:Tyrosine-protein kinase [Parasponia andersonii]